MMLSKIFNYIIDYYYSKVYKHLKKKWDNASMSSKIYGHVLVFHHITNNHVNINESCQHKVDEFASILQEYRENNFSFVPLETAIEYIQNDIDTKFVVITFDDVPDNVYYNAYPIMKRLGVPFTLFITTSYIDKVGFLTKSQIIELAKDDLCTIGAHTMTHPVLRKTNYAKEELLQSKIILEQLIDKKVRFMAYPYGRQSSVSSKIIKIAECVGYDSAFSTIQSPISDISKSNMFFLPRLVKKL